VRNGYKPERTIQTGIGDVVVKGPRVRDRAGAIKFHSSILPAYLASNAEYRRAVVVVVLESAFDG